MDLEQRAVARRIRQRETPPASCRQHHVDGTGPPDGSVSTGQPQPHGLTSSVSRAGVRCDTAGCGPRRRGPFARRALPGAVRAGARLAQQCEAVTISSSLMPAAGQDIDLARQQPGTTGAAVTALAAVRQVEPARSAAVSTPPRGRANCSPVGTIRAGHDLRMPESGDAKEASEFANPPFEAIAALLRSARTIAVVGLSANPARPSHRVARASSVMATAHPVNPGSAPGRAQGRCHAGRSLEALAPSERIDIVESSATRAHRRDRRRLHRVAGADPVAPARRGRRRAARRPRRRASA